MIAELRIKLGCAPAEEFSPAGMAFATTEVWLSSASVVKRFRGIGKLRTELAFYGDSAHHLPARTATALASCDAPPALWLTRLRGNIVAADPELQLPAVYRRAAESIAAFHRVPFADQDPVGLDDALELRFEGWFPRFAAVVPGELSDRAGKEWLKRQPLQQKGRTRTHRDYSDRNWLWDPGSDDPLGVIDFEQSRPDHPWVDLTRLWERDFHCREDLRRAFLTGYGGGADILRHPDFRTLALQHTIATIAWATETGDREYAALGKEALDRWFATL